MRLGMLLRLLLLECSLNLGILIVCLQLVVALLQLLNLLQLFGILRGLLSLQLLVIFE
jgi:hypothetical protein